MKITPQSQGLSQVTYTALVPKSAFKGPILKLTEKDKREIAGLMEEKTRKECQLYEMMKKYDKRGAVIPDYYSDIISDIHYYISYLDDKIRKIKLQRFEQQKQDAEEKAARKAAKAAKKAAKIDAVQEKKLDVNG